MPNRKPNLLREQTVEKKENSILVNSHPLPAEEDVNSRKSSPGLGGFRYSFPSDNKLSEIKSNKNRLMCVFLEAVAHFGVMQT